MPSLLKDFDLTTDWVANSFKKWEEGAKRALTYSRSTHLRQFSGRSRLFAQARVDQTGSHKLECSEQYLVDSKLISMC